jgi:hypothetical protein
MQSPSVHINLSSGVVAAYSVTMNYSTASSEQRSTTEACTFSGMTAAARGIVGFVLRALHVLETLAKWPQRRRVQKGAGSTADCCWVLCLANVMYLYCRSEGIFMLFHNDFATNLRRVVHPKIRQWLWAPHTHELRREGAVTTECA